MPPRPLLCSLGALLALLGAASAAYPTETMRRLTPPSASAVGADFTAVQEVVVSEAAQQADGTASGPLPRVNAATTWSLWLRLNSGPADGFDWPTVFSKSSNDAWSANPPVMHRTPTFYLNRDTTGITWVSASTCDATCTESGPEYAYPPGDDQHKFANSHVSTQIGNASPYSLPLNAWTHVAVTHAEGRFIIYINGAERYNEAFTAPVLNTKQLNLGGLTFPTVDAEVADWRYWNAELTQAQVQEVWAENQYGLVDPAVDTPPAAAAVAEGAAHQLTVAVPQPDRTFFQWTKDGADLDGETGATLDIASMTEADAGSYAVRVSNNRDLAGVTSAASELTLLCPAGDVVPTALAEVGGDAAVTGIQDGELRVSVDVDADQYTGAPTFRWIGGDDAKCGSATGPWTSAAVLCADRHTFAMDVSAALRDCGFSTEPQDGGTTWYYEAVVEATTQEPGEDVFGQPTTVTRTTAFRVRVELPKSVDVSASAVAYGDVIQFALLSQQEVDTSTPTAAFTWTLVTSVQYPYELTAKEVTEETAHVFESLGLSLSAASVACPASGACTQTFEITATESTSCELTDAELKSVFTIGCRSQFTGACDTPEGVETDTATFTVSTDSFCARVVEVATVTPTLTTSTSQGGASALDFVLQTTLFGRVTFAIEAGLSVTSTRLLSLDLVSEESVKPVTGAGVQDSAVVSAISFVESDQGGTEPHLDFQFQLNAESVKFAVGGGQASLTITAVVEVTYDGAGSQRFEVSTEAVSGPGSVSTAASSTVGVSTPAAPGSASTAGSTVLGVSTGTAMVAGVGLVAVVALAAGAAVVARKRRGSTTVARAAKMVQHSSSSVELDIAPAGGVAASPSIATADLGNVQAAYDASQ